MGKQFDAIDGKLAEFIRSQKMFFVGTAGRDTRVNVSPKGMDSLRVLGPNQVVWLNLTGSGNETAAHLLENSRMTIMFCAFEGSPMILRLYGQARAIHRHDAEWREFAAHFPPTPGARQIMELTVDLAQTSCGFGVPLFDYSGDRELLTAWAEKRGEDGIKDYWKEKNQVSLDGKPTRVLG